MYGSTDFNIHLCGSGFTCWLIFGEPHSSAEIRVSSQTFTLLNLQDSWPYSDFFVLPKTKESITEGICSFSIGSVITVREITFSYSYCILQIDNAKDLP